MSNKRRNWISKFQDALRGFGAACSEGQSFVVHFSFVVAVLLCGIFFQVTSTEWCVLVVCMAAVLTAETFNSALESLAKSITSEHDEHVGRALDMAAGAVLMMSIGSAVAGFVIFVPYLLKLLNQTAQ